MTFNRFLRDARIPTGAALVLAVALLHGIYLLAAPPGAAQDQGFTVERRVPYVGDGDPRHVMDVYTPSGKGPFPGVLVIHAGGWKSGSPQRMAHEAEVLARNGFVAFAVAYRLAPAFVYPTQVEDVQAAVRHIREHASDYDVMPKELGALGGSAGGHLAAMLGVAGSGPTDRDGRVNVVVSWSGPMDLTNLRQEIAERRRGRTSTETFLGCSLTDCPDLYRQASPIFNVDPTDAPMLIANSTLEKVSLPSAEEMADTLRQATVPVQLVVVPGRFHSVAMEDRTAPSLGGETVFEASIDFLNEWIGGRPQPSSSVTPSTSPPADDGSSNQALLFGIIAAVVVVAGAAVALPLIRRLR